MAKVSQEMNHKYRIAILDFLNFRTDSLNYGFLLRLRMRTKVSTSLSLNKKSIYILWLVINVHISYFHKMHCLKKMDNLLICTLKTWKLLYCNHKRNIATAAVNLLTFLYQKPQSLGYHVWLSFPCRKWQWKHFFLYFSCQSTL